MDIDTVYPKNLLYWDRMSSTEISAYLTRVPEEKRLILIVWGVIESHGPALGLGSDSMLAGLAADEVAQRLREEKGLEPIIFDVWKNVGSLSATRHFPGAIGFNSSTVPFIRQLWEQTLARLSKEGFSKFFVVNGDGGNWMNHWHGLKWDSPAIDELLQQGMKLDGGNWDQEGGAPYLHGDHHKHALTTWACYSAPEHIRLSAIRNRLRPPSAEVLQTLDGAEHAYLEDVPHRERDWSTYPEQDRLRSVTQFSLAEYERLLTSGDIGKDFDAKITCLMKKIEAMF